MQGIQCGIEVVMGMDIAHGHFMTLLTKTVNMCQYPERYRSGGMNVVIPQN